MKTEDGNKEKYIMVPYEYKSKKGTSEMVAFFIPTSFHSETISRKNIFGVNLNKLMQDLADENILGVTIEMVTEDRANEDL